MTLIRLVLTVSYLSRSFTIYRPGILVPPPMPTPSLAETVTGISHAEVRHYLSSHV